MRENTHFDHSRPSHPFSNYFSTLHNRYYRSYFDDSGDEYSDCGSDKVLSVSSSQDVWFLFFYAGTKDGEVGCAAINARRLVTRVCHYKDRGRWLHTINLVKSYLDSGLLGTIYMSSSQKKSDLASVHFHFFNFSEILYWSFKFSKIVPREQFLIDRVEQCFKTSIVPRDQKKSP